MYPYLEPGDVLDGFVVESRLHSGGMALLYRVQREAAAFPLIMKIPRLGQGEDAVSLVSFEVEQTMLSILKGPHVPRLVAAGDLARQPYLVMEYIDGPTLTQWAEQAPLAVPDLVRLMQALAVALEALHRQHLVHLDVKPANVLYRSNGEAVLIDLGIAHHAQLPDFLAEEFRRPIGSAPYMAPEQVAGVRCDPRSDLFAMGVLMYQLATGALPFGSPTSERGLRARLYEEPLPPRARRPDLPEGLQEIILRCLEVDADQRYASVAQLGFDLAHLDQLPVTERGRSRVRAGLWTRLLRRWAAVGYEAAPCPDAGRAVSAVPIVLVAVDMRQHDLALSDALQNMARRFADMHGDARIAIVSVIRPQPLLGTSDADDSAAKAHLRQLLELKHWARMLAVSEARLTFHVLEHTDPAQALLDYAVASQVDQIVIGCPRKENGPILRPLLGSVASRITLEAPCSVTIARPSASA